MRFLCALIAQLVDQPYTTFSFVANSKIHHQRPQPAGFSHIGWLELLPTSYKARETSLVSYKHNRKTKRCLAHLCLLPRNTPLSRRLSQFEPWARNQSKGLQRCGPRLSLRVTFHALRNAKECEGMNPHTPKWNPMDSQILRRQLQGSKIIGLRHSLYH